MEVSHDVALIEANRGISYVCQSRKPAVAFEVLG